VDQGRSSGPSGPISGGSISGSISGPRALQWAKWTNQWWINQWINQWTKLTEGAPVGQVDQAGVDQSVDQSGEKVNRRSTVGQRLPTKMRGENGGRKKVTGKGDGLLVAESPQHCWIIDCRPRHRSCFPTPVHTCTKVPVTLLAAGMQHTCAHNRHATRAAPCTGAHLLQPLAL